MIVCIIADTHIHPFQSFATGTGSSNSRVQISLNALEQVGQFCARERITQLWHLGDVFHARDHQRFPVFNCVYDAFRKLSKKLELHFVVGNHDVVDKLGTLTIHAFKEFARVHDQVEWNSDIFIVPYATNYDEIENMIHAMEPVNIVKLCCLGHLDVKGARPGSSLFALENGIDPAVFSPFKATVLGHYHVHQSIGQDQRIHYAGALTPVDFGEVDQPGIFCTLDTDTGDTLFHSIDCPKFVKLDAAQINSDGTISPAIASLLKGNFVRFECKQTTQLNTQLAQVGVAAAEFIPRVDDTEHTDRIENIGSLNWQELMDQYVKVTNPASNVDRERLSKIGMELLT